MSSLAWLTGVCGGGMVMAGAVAIWRADTVRELLARFPRSRVSGYGLAALGLGWFGYLLYLSPWLDQIERFKPLMIVAVPLFILLVCIYADDLLAPRALGGLCVLMPQYLLEAGRWHASPLSLLTQGLAYLVVVAGVVLVLTPYMFRKTHAWVYGSGVRARLVWGCILGMGVGMLAMSRVFAGS